MATDILIPGLNRGLTEADMVESRQLYNNLPSDEAQPEAEQFLQQLAKIFVQHNAHNTFGVHLIHRHLQLPERNVLLRSDTSLRCSWAKPTVIDSHESNRWYGHTFILTDNGFHPYEYHSGEKPDMAQINHSFLSELASFLSSNGLSDVFALEILDRPLPEVMVEIVLQDQGTIMIEPERLSRSRSRRQTGWAFSDQNGEAHVCKDGRKEHATHPVHGHIVVVTPRDNIRIESCSDALATLREYGYLN